MLIGMLGLGTDRVPGKPGETGLFLLSRVPE
jgi:hypothetical protein